MSPTASKEEPKLTLQSTEDGSHTLYREDLNETYHSHKGARAESLYVFIEQGVKYLQAQGRNNIGIFEVGFGTGLNAWLAWQFAKENDIRISYCGVEPFPVPKPIWEVLNYSPDLASFQSLHQAAWGTQHSLDNHFLFIKLQQTLEQYEDSVSADVVFMDAFAPSKQPDIWSKANLLKCYNLLTNKGVLVTYCAQGQFKRDLKSIGFQVQSLPGALGKKEMVRAIKP